MITNLQDILKMSSAQLAERALLQYPDLDPARIPNTPGPFAPGGAGGLGEAINQVPGTAGAAPAGMNPGQMALMGSQMLGQPKRPQPYFPNMGQYGGASLAKPHAPQMQMAQAPGVSLGRLIGG